MPSKKQIKAAEKAGGKVAQDICGINETGGMCYFTQDMPLCKGDRELLELAMTAANKPVDESSGDRKGGAGDLAKCWVTLDDTKQIVIMIHVPKTVSEKLTLDEWYAAVTAGLNGEQVHRSDELVIHVAPNDPQGGFFALKMKDQAINQSIALLRERGLIVEDDDSECDMGEMYEQAGIEW